MSKKSLACIPLAVAGAALTASAGAPVTAQLIAGTLLTGAASNLFNKSLDEGAEKLGNIFSRASSESDPIITALRQAHLDALDTILKKFDAAQKTNPSADKDSKRFSSELKNFIKDARKSLKSKKTGVATTFERDVFALLPSALDSMQDNAEHSPSSEATATAANTIQTDLTETVFQEVVVATGSTPHEVPEAFKKRFYDPGNGWFTHFTQNAINALKNNEAFKSLWTMEQLGRIKSLSVAMFQGVNTISEQQKQDSTKLDDISAKVDKMEKILSRTAHEKSIDPEHIRPILERLGHTDTQIEEIPALLAHAVDELLARAESLETSHNDGTLIDQAIHAAREKLRSADVDGAALILDSAIEDAQDQLEQRQKATARLHFEKAFLKRTIFDYEEAIHSYLNGLKLDANNSAGLYELGRIYETTGRSQLALNMYQKCTNSLKKVIASDTNDFTQKRNLAVSLERMGDITLARGGHKSALNYYQESYNIFDDLSKNDQTEIKYTHERILSLIRVGDSYFLMKDTKNSLYFYSKARRLYKTLAKKDSKNIEWLHDISIILSKIGNIFRQQGNLLISFKRYQQSYEINLNICNLDPNNRMMKRSLAASINKLGTIHYDLKNHKAALEILLEGKSIIQELSQVDPENKDLLRDSAVFSQRLAQTHLEKGRTLKALGEYSNAFEIIKSLSTSDPDNADWSRDLCFLYMNLAKIDPQNRASNMKAAKGIFNTLLQREKLSKIDQEIFEIGYNTYINNSSK
ncbi:tetratricopeptide repeat protein [Thalassospira sp. HF15]|uniref:tetratricopeptide repeat protein n=1 Tax=Thalassospira sp. HF15 TaxID=2722755 RepID=UPI00143201E6|nr:tetratricopeptide repeat protein [Thalassospira sp. HF15]NIY76913.1 tetratricopeptide repeat protein [Thalassospira sp. HF15]